MRYGIFGGSFDPVHFGHLLLAETCLRHCGLDRIIFVPAGIPPHKQDKERTPGDLRAQMLEIALGEYDEYSVSRYEIERNEIGYTIDTLLHFKESLLDPELFLILGADMFNDLPNWKEVTEILQLSVPVVAFRAGHIDPYYEALGGLVSIERITMFRDYLVPMPGIELSSSQMRKNISEGKSVRFMTPRIVENFIKHHGLYVRES